MPTGSRRAISREAVVLDLMQPSGARRRLGDLNGEAGLDEADRQGTRTRQHRLEDSSVRTNREPFHQPFHQQVGEITSF